MRLVYKLSNKPLKAKIFKKYNEQVANWYAVQEGDATMLPKAFLSGPQNVFYLNTQKFFSFTIVKA